MPGDSSQRRIFSVSSAVAAGIGPGAGRTVSADRLAEGLWGDRLPSSAPKMVQLYVSHLRQVLSGNGAEILTLP